MYSGSIPAAALFLVMAAGPLHADMRPPPDGFTVVGPTCRLSDCWAVVMDDSGWGRVIRAKGVVRTRALTRELLDQMSGSRQNHPTCVQIAGGVQIGL